MTWEASEGDRSLTGCEAELVREALAVMVDRVSENLDYRDVHPRWDFGVALFDELTPTEQVSVIQQVAAHLLTRTPQTLELTAVNEAAAYAIFRTIATEIEIEIDVENLPGLGEYGPVVEEDEPKWQVHWRSQVLQAYRACNPQRAIGPRNDQELEDGEAWTLPTADCSEFDQWESLVESLADRVLWDRDFEIADSFLDTEPAKAAAMKQALGVDDGYYTDVAPELRREQIQPMLDSVRAITHRKPR